LNYLSVETLSKSFGETPLFENLTFGMSKGTKTALIAKNGSGKSTLLEILVGNQPPDKGKVVIRNGITVGFLPQNPVLPEEKTIDEFIASGNIRLSNILKSYETALLNQSEFNTPESHMEFEKASEKMTEAGGWDYENRMKQILSEFHIEDLSQHVSSLSGGERKRLALAEVLIDQPDFLILDEPTNHLDIAVIEWLEKYLIQTNMTLLMVTHDRYFLDRVCDHILELDNGSMYSHQGNFAKFLINKAAREKSNEVSNQKSRQFLKKEIDWIRRAPKARTSKSKSRIDAFYNEKKKISWVVSQQDLQLDIKMSRLGGVILELKDVFKSFGQNKILDNFSYTFKKGDRIGLLGKNGAGKSTFLDLITASVAADAGEIKKGETVRFGYYKQDGIKLAEDKRVIDVLKSSAEVIKMSDGREISASQLLEFFLFSTDLQYNYVSKLSGGERRRLTLLMVLIQNPNFLIMDEPTNDLDLHTLLKLEEFLESFSGCLIIVSHDRFFLDKLVEHYFIFEGNGILRDFYGNYQEYKESLKRTSKEKKKSVEKPNRTKTKRSFKENKEYDELELSINKLEKAKIELENQLSQGLTDYKEIEEIGIRIQEVNGHIDDQTLRWMELDEI